MKPTCRKCDAPMQGEGLQGYCPACAGQFAFGPSADDEAGGLSRSQTVVIPEGTTLRAGSSAAECASSPLARFGDYELLEEIARGGMGVVYKARQKSLERMVAVKMILAGQFAGKQLTQRFRGEAAAAGTLQHPNIVAIHEIGMHEGQHFFSMDFVEGQNLAQLVGNRPLPSMKAARYVKLLAEAIHYAHQQGILHRDLKPSNVLIDAATDQPRVTDFGLAKRLDGESSLTVTGQVLGSPNFMPPEQASGSRGKVGRHSDVYGLGGILFYLLTARAPFQGETLETTIHEVLHTEPLSPRGLNPSVPRDLETICLKCLEKEPSRRYQSAQELAEELARFQRDEPIRARPVGRAEHVWRWCRRKPAIASSLALAAVLLMVVAVGSPIAAYRINQERNQKELEAYAADMALVQLDLRDNNFGRAFAVVQKYAHPKRGQADIRGWEWRYLWSLCQNKEKRAFGSDTNGTQNAVFSPDGKMLATAGEDHTAKIWDMASGSLVATLTGFNDHIDQRGLRFSPDGKFLAAKGGTRVRVWDTKNWQAPVDQFEGEPNREETINDAVVFSPDSQTIVTRIVEGVGFRRLGSGRWGQVLTNPPPPNSDQAISKEGQFPGSEIRRNPSPVNFGRVLEFSPDAKVLAVSHWSRLHLFEWPSLAEITTLVRDEAGPDHAFRVLSAAFSAEVMGVGYRDGVLKLFEVGTWKEIAQFEAHKSYALSLAFSPDGKTLATGGSDQLIKLWDIAATIAASSKLKQPRPVSTLLGHRGRVQALDFSPKDGRLLASVCGEEVKLWELPIQAEETALPDSLNPWGFTSDGKALITGASDRRWQIWDLASKRVTATLGPFDTGTRVHVSQNGKWIAALGTNGIVQVRSLNGNQAKRSLPLPAGDPISHLVCSPGGDLIGIAIDELTENGRRRVVRIFSLATGQAEHVFSDNYGPLEFSPDGRSFAFHGKGNEIQVFDLATGTMRYRLPAPTFLIECFAFSPDSRLLAAGMGDFSVVIWDLASGRQIHWLKGDRMGITDISFSPDLKLVATCNPDNIVRIWHIPTGREILRFEKVIAGFGSGPGVRFSPDGNFFAMVKPVSGSQAVELLRAPTFEEIAEAEKQRRKENENR